MRRPRFTFHLRTLLCVSLTLSFFLYKNTKPDVYPAYSDPPELGGKLEGYIPTYGWPYMYYDSGYIQCSSKYYGKGLIANLFLAMSTLISVYVLSENSMRWGKRNAGQPALAKTQPQPFRHG